MASSFARYPRSVTFCFAALLYWGFPVAALLRAVTTLVVALSARRAVFRAAFNAAQLTLSLAAAVAVLAVAGIHPSVARPWVPSGTELGAVGLAAFTVPAQGRSWRAGQRSGLSAHDLVA